MYKDEMMVNVIRRFGFEHKMTIWFAECCETMDGSPLLNAYICAITFPVENGTES